MTGSFEKGVEPRPSVSIVIPTRNRAELLAKCLESLAALDFPRTAYEVIVVDDFSTDHTLSVVRSVGAAHGGLQVSVVEAKVRGVNGARNTGFTVATGSIVSFIDDDELVPSGWLTRAVGGLARHPEFAGVGGPYRELAKDRLPTCGRCSGGGGTPALTGAGSPLALLGGNMVLRRAAFDVAGLFDVALSGHGDDTEWFVRARRAGLAFFFDDQLWVWHRPGARQFRDLAVGKFRQGRSVPEALRKMGEAPLPHGRRMLRAFGHAVLNRCGTGFLVACREAGALVESAWRR